jgi:hypothetical protein
MIVDVLYRGLVLGTTAALEEAGGLFVSLEPMPVGTALTLRRDGQESQWRVVRAQEVGSVGMLVGPVGGGALQSSGRLGAPDADRVPQSTSRATAEAQAATASIGGDPLAPPAGAAEPIVAEATAPSPAPQSIDPEATHPEAAAAALPTAEAAPMSAAAPPAAAPENTAPPKADDGKGGRRERRSKKR